MTDSDHVVYVNYREAQTLLPLFQWAVKNGPYKEAKASASKIARELEGVRNVDYSPLPGKQIFLNEAEFEYFLDVRNMVKDRGH